MESLMRHTIWLPAQNKNLEFNTEKKDVIFNPAGPLKGIPHKGFDTFLFPIGNIILFACPLWLSISYFKLHLNTHGQFY